MSRPILVAVLVLVLGGPAFGQAQTGVPGTSGAPIVSGEPLPPGLQGGIPVEGAGIPEGGGIPDAGADTSDGTQFWAQADYLLGWIRGAALPALVTTSPPGTAQPVAGIQGVSTTTVLFGGSRVNDEVRSGFNFKLGYWFDVERNLGAQVGFFVFENQSTGLALNSDGTTIIARPFINPADSTQLAILVAYPGVSSAGSINAIAGSHALFGFNADLTETMFCCAGFRMESLVGYRCLRFDDRLVINQTSFPVGGPLAAGSKLVAEDSFGAQNTFHGFEVGVRTELDWGSLSLELLTKLGAGYSRRNISILGGTTAFVPGAAPVSSVGGLLALTSNIGNHRDDEWALVPEVGLTLGWQLTQSLRFRAGYTFLLWSQVARAGEQVDLTINQNLIPPQKEPFDPQRPQFRIQQSDLVLQALHFGLELRY